jgi:hypothetical protein
MRFVWLVGVLVAGAGLVEAAEPEFAVPPFVVEKETTYFVGPLRNDGMIDYVAAINDRLSAGVAKENNAAIGLLEAIDAGRGAQAAHYARVRGLLGMPAPGKGEGAAVDFNQIADKAAPWFAAADPATAKKLEEVAARLDMAVEASKREKFYIPLVRGQGDLMPTLLLPQLSDFRMLTEALRTRAMLRLGNNDVAGFRSDAIAVVRLGRLMTNGSTLVEMFVAAAVEARGLDALRVAAAGGWLSADEAAKALAELGAAPAARPVYEGFETTERAFVLEFMQFAAVHGIVEAERQLRFMMAQQNQPMIPMGIADAAGKDWSEAMRRVNRWYDRLVEVGKKPTYAERQKAAEALAKDAAALRESMEGIKVVLTPLEDRLIVMIVPAIEKAYVRETRLETSRELTRTALALAGFHAKTGAYPRELKELVPAYLKEAPVDPFSAEPLSYKAEGAGYVMQSAGPDGKDDGRGAEGLVVRADK